MQHKEVIKLAEIQNIPLNEKLRDSNPKVNQNFKNINEQLVDHINSSGAHAAEDITYNGEVSTAENVRDAIDAIDIRIDSIVASSGDDNTEIVDARGTFPVLSARLDNTDQQFQELAGTYIKKNSMYANPMDYGAVGDGVANDYNAITAAINTGLPLKLPKGIFFIGTNTLDFGECRYVFGSGRDNTEIHYNGNNDASTITTNHGFVISDLTFRNTGTPAGGSAINVSAANYGVIDRVNFADVYHGITTQNCQGNKYTNIDAWGFSGNCLFFAGHNNDIFVKNCFINGQLNGQAGHGTGLNIINRGEALTFDSVEIILCDTALSTYATDYSAGNRPAFCRFTNCFFDSSTTGVNLDRVVNFHFVNTWFSNRPENGIRIITAFDVVFQTCSFVNSAKHGAVVEAPAKKVKFLGCTFEGNSTSSPNAYNGLQINANVTDFIVKDCTAYNGDSYGSQGYGIRVEPGASDRYIIADNLISGNGTGGVSDNGTGTNKRVANNY